MYGEELRQHRKTNVITTAGRTKYPVGCLEHDVLKRENDDLRREVDQWKYYCREERKARFSETRWDPRIFAKTPKEQEVIDLGKNAYVPLEQLKDKLGI